MDDYVNNLQKKSISTPALNAMASSLAPTPAPVAQQVTAQQPYSQHGTIVIDRSGNKHYVFYDKIPTSQYNDRTKALLNFQEEQAGSQQPYFANRPYDVNQGYTGGSFALNNSSRYFNTLSPDGTSGIISGTQHAYDRMALPVPFDPTVMQRYNATTTDPVSGQSVYADPQLRKAVDFYNQNNSTFDNIENQALHEPSYQPLPGDYSMGTIMGIKGSNNTGIPGLSGYKQGEPFTYRYYGNPFNPSPNPPPPPLKTWGISQMPATASSVDYPIQQKQPTATSKISQLSSGTVNGNLQ